MVLARAEIRAVPSFTTSQTLNLCILSSDVTSHMATAFRTPAQFMFHAVAHFAPEHSVKPQKGNWRLHGRDELVTQTRQTPRTMTKWFRIRGAQHPPQQTLILETEAHPLSGPSFLQTLSRWRACGDHCTSRHCQNMAGQ